MVMEIKIYTISIGEKHLGRCTQKQFELFL